MEYRECPCCGAVLDPGEVCECQKEKGLPDANQTSPADSEATTANSISRDKSQVKMNPLRELRISKNLAAKDMVTTVRDLYPLYDKTLQSKCERDEYGIDLKPKAMDALLEKYAPELLEKERHRRDGRHRLKRKVMCRLDDAEYEALKKRIKKDGFDTMQAWLAYMIRHYLSVKRKEGFSHG